MATTKAGPVDADRLKSFVERIERLEEERKAIGGDVKDVYSEAKGVGYDVKTMRQIVKERSQDAADRDEQETLLDVYRHALGMGTYRSVAAQYGISKSKLHRLVPREENGTSHNAERGELTDERSASIPTVAEDHQGRREGSGGGVAGGPLAEAGQGRADARGDGADAGSGGEQAPLVPTLDEAPTTPSVGAVEEINLASKPASIMPCSMTWERITQTREAHHAAIEAAREARHQQRQRDRERSSVLSQITAADMPAIPAFLRRSAA
jgi:uncharacterized protein (UPF0335 family)